MKPTKKLSVSEAARRIGTSRQALDVHRRKPGTPALDDTEGWRTYLAANGREGSAPPEIRAKIAKERHKLLAAMAEREQLRLSKDKGEVIAKAEVSTALARGMSVLFGQLESIFSNEFPRLVVGLEPAAIAAQARDAIEKLREGLRAEFSKFL